MLRLRRSILAIPARSTLASSNVAYSCKLGPASTTSPTMNFGFTEAMTFPMPPAVGSVTGSVVKLQPSRVGSES